MVISLPSVQEETQIVTVSGVIAEPLKHITQHVLVGDVCPVSVHGLRLIEVN